MTKKHKSAVQSPAHRVGDGVPLDAEIIVGADGRTIAAFGFNVENAPVPDRRYVADVASVKNKNGTVKLLFGQEKVSSSDLRSLLVIHLNEAAVRHFVSSLKNITHPSIMELMQTHHLAQEPLADNIIEPEQTVAFASNIMAVALSGRDSCIDFYQISPFSFANAPKTKKIGVEPVVRVDMRTPLLASLIDVLDEIEKSLPRDYDVMKEAV